MQQNSFVVPTKHFAISNKFWLLERNVLLGQQKKFCCIHYFLSVPKSQGYIRFLDNPHGPDSVFRVDDFQMTVPIANETSKPNLIITKELHYKFIKSEPTEEKIHFISGKELLLRIKLLNGNSRVAQIEPHFHETITKITNSYYQHGKHVPPCVVDKQNLLQMDGSR